MCQVTKMTSTPIIFMQPVIPSSNTIRALCQVKWSTVQVQEAIIPDMCNYCVVV